MTVADAGVRPPVERSRAPWHLWLVGILSLLWNAIGAFDYLASQMRLDFYMSQFSEEQLAYFYGFPAWAVATWAFGVWGGFFGSAALLLRRSWAVWLFGLSLAGMAVNTVYTFGMSEGLEIMGTGGAIFMGVIWIIAILLFFYARAQAKKGVLR
jgi:hypothetical protein